MAKVLIENYRGVEISYDTNDDKFVFELADGDISVGKLNLKTSRKYIDDYFKDNNNFKPFKAYIINSYESLPSKVFDVIGVRKDGRYIIKKGGKVEQLSTYDEPRCYKYEDVNEIVFAKIAVLLGDINRIQDEIKKEKLKLKLNPLKSDN